MAEILRHNHLAEKMRFETTTIKLTGVSSNFGPPAENSIEPSFPSHSLHALILSPLSASTSPFPSLPPLEIQPLNPAKGLGKAVSYPSTPAETDVLVHFSQGMRAWREWKEGERPYPAFFSFRHLVTTNDR